MEVATSKGGISVSTFVLDLLTKTRMLKYKPRDTPIEIEKFRKARRACGERQVPKISEKIDLSILHHNDITFVVSVMSQNMHFQRKLILKLFIYHRTEVCSLRKMKTKE